MVPELFVMPVPLSFSKKFSLIVVVNALAPELNVMLLTSVISWTVMAVRLLVAKTAVALGPFGAAVLGFQLFFWFQSLLPAFESQLEPCAEAKVKRAKITPSTGANAGAGVEIRRNSGR